MWRSNRHVTSVRLDYSWVVLLFVCISALTLAAQIKNSCINCHGSQSDALKKIVDESMQSVHSHKGMSCDTCHGGNPREMDTTKAHGTGFHGQIKREEIPQ